eukprot:NODE_5234_length_419_cov_83.097297_g4557_i0.p1 GENE.NODE_5234_length_419_cov_83.097297_g4557_i0~~NODE_5234_length_419_cov_83.097297_g4557_i0.p1  ORF type:complete len:57 (-),score=1.88 NODE_5234_length_419_cov_83.097297_g4557_i0:55-225(-)
MDLCILMHLLDVFLYHMHVPIALNVGNMVHRVGPAKQAQNQGCPTCLTTTLSAGSP